MTGAALYIKRDLLERIGPLDEGYAMAFEDVDYCLRAWDAGYRVLYFPAASLTHLESKTRGMTQGTRELESQVRFWGRWGSWFDERPVRTADGRLRIVYVTEDTGIGGGHRVVFQHLEGLAARGHDVELWTLGGEPDWFELTVPVRSFASFNELASVLAAGGRDQGRHVVADGAGGVARGGPARHPGLLRPGHRDVVLPAGAHVGAARARHLPAGVPLPDDVGLERGRAGSDGVVAEHRLARPRSRSLPSARAGSATIARCWRSDARTR